MNYIFEWDPAKATANLSKHGVSFEQAAMVFRDPRQISVFDDEHSDEEDRWVTIGIDSEGTLLVVIHTYRTTSDDDVTIRLISTRKANRYERRQYSGHGH
jgi:uncharacterized DUF497 family protein